ncbi:hypothetical protein BU17DRAFT_88426 [Hysterangium stoloniferum]|nr:hypothetical protein BU17DRAFT_88426 [Hysterangium stoloniferum]
MEFSHANRIPTANKATGERGTPSLKGTKPLIEGHESSAVASHPPQVEYATFAEFRRAFWPEDSDAKQSGECSQPAPLVIPNNSPQVLLTHNDTDHQSGLDLERLQQVEKWRNDVHEKRVVERDRKRRSITKNKMTRRPLTRQNIGRSDPNKLSTDATSNVHCHTNEEIRLKDPSFHDDQLLHSGHRAFPRRGGVSFGSPSPSHAVDYEHSIFTYAQADSPDAPSPGAFQDSQVPLDPTRRNWCRKVFATPTTCPHGVAGYMLPPKKS